MIPKMRSTPPACHRCGREFDPERADLDLWIVLDARDDGWVLVACRDCQTQAERERIDLLIEDLP
jgi:hypothetical protein